MRTELFSSAGIYAPTFLNIRIATNESLDNIFNLSPTASAAFIHEYVHFLQDITTVYGLRNIIMVVDKMKTVNLAQRESGSKVMKIPYEFNDFKFITASYNSSFQKIVNGTFDDTPKASIHSIIKRTEKIEFQQEAEIEVIEVWLGANKLKFDFGSHAVLESMAYLVEQSIYPSVIPEPTQFCYHAASMIAETIYPEFSEKRTNLIALCDASLMFANPGLVFHRMLHSMRAENFLPTTYMEIYEFVFVREQQSYAQLNYWDSILNNHTLTAISQLNDYFTIEEFDENKEWIEFTLNNANKFRHANISFFTELAEGGTLSANRTFEKLFALVGMPITTNSEGQAWFATNVSNQEKVRPEILWAVNQIYNLYGNSKNSRSKRCWLENWCQKTCDEKNITDYTDQRCYDNPWDRHLDGKELCTFSQVWRSWGMESHIPTQ
jgi:hypothetical protein